VDCASAHAVASTRARAVPDTGDAPTAEAAHVSA
jgi:hypothetical protein